MPMHRRIDIEGGTVFAPVGEGCRQVFVAVQRDGLASHILIMAARRLTK